MVDRLKSLDDRQKLIIGFCLIAGVVILSMLQDFTHSQVRNYNFQLSESLLYNSFWMLFVPIILLQIWLFKTFAVLSKHLRVILQLMVTGFLILLHLVSFPLVVVGFSDLFFDHTYRFQNVLDYELSEYLYFIISVYLTLGLLMIFRPFRKEIAVEHNLKTIKTLIIQKGTERIKVDCDSIYCITSEAPYVAIRTLDKKYLYSDTLASLTSRLDKSQFVRIHKSTIIHIGKMASYTSRKNGDYDVVLNNGIKKRVSRTYAPDFKNRIE